MLRDAVTLTSVEEDPKELVDAVTTALPRVNPERLAFADWLPAGMVTVGVSTSTTDASELETVSVRPPDGAGSESEMGNDAVPPKGTFSDTGVPTMAIVMSTIPFIVFPPESVTVALIRCDPADRVLTVIVPPLPSGPSTSELHSILAVRSPSSGSVALATKVIASPGSKIEP